VQFHDPLGQGQADARALSEGIELVEQTEHPPVMTSANPHAVVLHEEDGFRLASSTPDHDQGAVWSPMNFAALSMRFWTTSKSLTRSPWTTGKPVSIRTLDPALLEPSGQEFDGFPTEDIERDHRGGGQNVTHA